ncbi:MAG: alpha/beta fold hydrolase [Methylohalobius sp. ZOD2]|nr:alpha/beta fold hydrolase [Methylothermaceae bacterium]
MATTDQAPVDFDQQPYAEYRIDTVIYDRAARLLRFAQRFLNIHFKLHAPETDVHRGQIFVFNHFARFETLIPQYLIHECCGAYCCAIAHRELFHLDPQLTRVLLAIGAIPHDHPQLFPLLATQILRGRKVIVFPEGGMVKDRRVIDAKGRYRIYSRTTHTFRRHHSGAAVLALGLDIFKQAVLAAEREGEEERLEAWQEQLDLPDRDALLARCREPTLIVPADITFFPLRIDDNLLKRAVQIIRPGIGKRSLEELLIEGNLLMKDTDMDIHLGDPIRVDAYPRFWDRWLIQTELPHIGALDGIFNWRDQKNLKRRFLAWRIHHNGRRIRDRYMEAIYREVTVNPSHLAATLIYHALAEKRTRIARKTFRKALYLAIKAAQREPTLFLHRSLRNPDNYLDLPETEPSFLNQFLSTAESAGLIEPVGAYYHFLPKLCEEFELDTIRLENPVMVYANEVAPLTRIKKIVQQALRRADKLTPREKALQSFDDEVRAWHWDKAFYTAPCFEPLNRLEILRGDNGPFLLPNPPSGKKGVLLIHGLLSSPVAMRSLGEYLADAGYVVLAIRLKGHGTSPCDLRERRWKDWYASVRRGYRILAGLTETIALVGFSTGGLLALRQAADQPDQLAAVVAVATPVKFRTPTMTLVSLVHHTNRWTHWMRNGGFKAFVANRSEFPEINYRHIPIPALHELRQVISETESRLADVKCPVLLLQGDADPVVDPDSAEWILEHLGSRHKILIPVATALHNMIFKDPGGVHDRIRRFFDQHTALEP